MSHQAQSPFQAQSPLFSDADLELYCAAGLQGDEKALDALQNQVNMCFKLQSERAIQVYDKIDGYGKAHWQVLHGEGGLPRRIYGDVEDKSLSWYCGF
jgi:hypothetical protein